jgi:lichenysin synthetase B
MGRHRTNLESSSMIVDKNLTLAVNQSAGDVAAAFLLLLRKCYGDEHLTVGLVTSSSREHVTTVSYECSISAGSTLAEHARNTEAEIRIAYSTDPQAGEPHRFVFAPDSVPGRESFFAPKLRFELAACVEDSNGQLVLHVCSPEHDQAYLRRVAEAICQILERMSSAPDTRIGDLEMLTDAERATILNKFNATARDYPRSASIPQLFHEQVMLGPDRTAVVHGDVSLSYRELDEWSRQLATILRDHGVGRHGRVALMLDRGAEMVASTLAILRAGATYVPIDPGYPSAHVEFLLRDSGPRLLLTRDPYGGFAGVDTVNLADVTLPKIRAVALEEKVPTERVSAEDGAYIMYTSGSTGRPKGVRVNHRAVVRLVKNTNFIALTTDTRILQTGAVAFDAITFELWAALLNGGTVILVPSHAVLDATTLGELIRRHAATTMWLTAPLFHRLVDRDPTIFGPLRELLVGGDVLSVRHIAQAMAACPGLLIINGYGPTENTTFSTTHHIRQRPAGRIPIGRPIGNSTAYVLDLDRKLQPIGVPGELYVGGDGLSDGYLNRPKLTETAFVDNPFDSGRLYRTGDSARWLPDGTIDFLGRIDNQVKIRGFRVELAEVEQHLRRAKGVREAAVLLRERADGVEKYLCGFVTADGELSMDALRSALQAELPAHMVPSALVQLDRMPLNGNGKVDRLALAARHAEPAATASAGARDTTHRDDVEHALTNIWRQALELAEVRVTDNFFDVGGTSLAAAMLSTKIHSALGIHVPAATILAHPTIEELAHIIRGDTTESRPRVTPVQPRPFYPITFQQRGIYVEQQKDLSAKHYNVPIVIDVPYRVDPVRFARAIRALVARHEILRTTFLQLGKDTVQRVHDTVDVSLEMLAEPPGPAFVRSFDLTRGPLIRVGLHHAGVTSKIAIDVHHIVVDGITMGVLLDELTALYHGTTLAAPPLRYADYAVWQSTEDARQLLDKQEPFWLKKFVQPPRAAPLPTDFERAAVRDTQGSLLEFDFAEDRSERLGAYSRRWGVTTFHTLVATYFLFLARVTGQDDLTVGTPVTGRTMPELARVAGMFTNTLCLRAQISPQDPFIDFLQNISHEMVETFGHQDYPLSHLVDRVATERDYGRHPLFDTMIAYQDTGLMDRQALGGHARPADWMAPDTMFDLNLQVYDTNRSLRAVWGYSTGLFREKTVLLFRDNLLELIDAILAMPQRCVGELISGATTTRATRPVSKFDFGEFNFG